ncbi:primosomal protein [Mycoplasma sp. CAG:611]|nr:primosomal protein [Mycoplasma sp. CAG:611]
MVCECLVELEHVFIDKTFTYKINKEQLPLLKVGMRVVVPFGKQTLEGFVLKIYENKDVSLENKLKEIISIVDTYPILNEELLTLGKYISKTTLCSLMTSYQAMLPKALKAKKKVNMTPKYDTYICINYGMYNNDIKFNASQEKILELLKENKKVKKEVLNKISVSSVNTLLKKNILLEEKEENYRYNLINEEKIKFNLNEEQQKVYKEIFNSINTNETFLLYGVTGSGKTNVYMKVIEDVIKNNKTAILLVPEISLTPQIIKRFTSYFSNIAVLHSGLSDGEKYDEWRKINEGKVNIVIGARSAIFAPLKNIGVIIIDEEHSQTYKQENNPRYNAIDIAKERCKYHNCPLILGSATPSLESFARAKKNVYKLLELKNRYNNNTMPKVEIIDMNKEFKKASGYFSNTLIDQIKETLERKEQVILFLNRRGYSSFLTCSSCGYVEKCPNCDISLTYHKSSNMLRCHYCGYATKRKKLCPKCQEEFKDYGIGTEKVEEELKSLIKDAKIIRMDVDTTTTKNAHAKIINSFLEEKYNILIGTQMIAKGLDFPNVTLVGVLNADIGLNFPDFRSSETTFSLLNQVLGRSGRGNKEGKVLIQTFNPEHYAITYTKNHDYLGFYNEEMKIRKILKYPPYYYICSIKIISKDYNLASKSSYDVVNYLKQNIKNEIILGPSVCNVFKLNNNYRFQIIIKYKDVNNILEYLNNIEHHYFNKKDIKVEIDFNPLKL